MYVVYPCLSHVGLYDPTQRGNLPLSTVNCEEEVGGGFWRFTRGVLRKSNNGDGEGDERKHKVGWESQPGTDAVCIFAAEKIKALRLISKKSVWIGLSRFLVFFLGGSTLLISSDAQS